MGFLRLLHSRRFEVVKHTTAGSEVFRVCVKAVEVESKFRRLGGRRVWWFSIPGPAGVVWSLR